MSIHDQRLCPPTRLALPLACLCWSLPLLGFGEETSIEGRGPWGASADGLSLRLTVHKEQYRIGEPVHVLVEVINRSPRTIALGLEPLVQVGIGRFSRQSAYLEIVASQDGGYFSTTHRPFPFGTRLAAKAVVVRPASIYSETITLRPWGVNLGSRPSRPETAAMTIRATLRQFLMPDLRAALIKSQPVAFKVRLARAARNKTTISGDPAGKHEPIHMRPQPSDISNFHVLTRPSDIDVYQIDRATFEKVVASWREVPRDQWLHDYSHVGGLDYKGIATLSNGDQLQWMIRPGGLATLTFADGFVMYLVLCQD